MFSDFGGIILVGLTPDTRAQRLLSSLADAGLTITQVEETRGVAPLLGQMPKATIVIYSPDGRHDVERVLDELERAHRGSPVVALVEHSDFGHYYSLMNRGAVEYFELGEDPSIIARGVEWAARRMAA